MADIQHSMASEAPENAKHELDFKEHGTTQPQVSAAAVAAEADAKAHEETILQALVKHRAAVVIGTFRRHSDRSLVIHDWIGTKSDSQFISPLLHYYKTAKLLL